MWFKSANLSSGVTSVIYLSLVTRLSVAILALSLQIAQVVESQNLG